MVGFKNRGTCCHNKRLLGNSAGEIKKGKKVVLSSACLLYVVDHLREKQCGSCLRVDFIGGRFLLRMKPTCSCAPAIIGTHLRFLNLFAAKKIMSRGCIS